MGLEQALGREPTFSQTAAIAKSISEIEAPAKFRMAEINVLTPKSGLSPNDKELLATLRRYSGSFIGYDHDFSASYSSKNYAKISSELAKRPTWVQSVTFLEGEKWPYSTVAAYSFTDKPQHDTFLI